MIAVFDTVTRLPELRRWSNLVPPWWRDVQSTAPEPGAPAEAEATLDGRPGVDGVRLGLRDALPRYRAKLALTAAGLLALIYYMRIGEGRQADHRAVGIVARARGPKREVEYQRIDVVAYSFGTIIAIDALFPLGRPPGGVSR